MAISLVALIIVFNLFFKDMSFDVETKTLEGAPTLDYHRSDSQPESHSKSERISNRDAVKTLAYYPTFKRDHILKSNVSVPEGFIEPVPQADETNSASVDETLPELMPGFSPDYPQSGERPLSQQASNSSGVSELMLPSVVNSDGYGGGSYRPYDTGTGPLRDPSEDMGLRPQVELRPLPAPVLKRMPASPAQTTPAPSKEVTEDDSMFQVYIDGFDSDQAAQIRVEGLKKKELKRLSLIQMDDRSLS